MRGRPHPVWPGLWLVDPAGPVDLPPEARFAPPVALDVDTLDAAAGSAPCAGWVDPWAGHGTLAWLEELVASWALGQPQHLTITFEGPGPPFAEGLAAPAFEAFALMERLAGRPDRLLPQISRCGRSLAIALAWSVPGRCGLINIVQGVDRLAPGTCELRLDVVGTDGAVSADVGSAAGPLLGVARGRIGRRRIEAPPALAARGAAGIFADAAAWACTTAQPRRSLDEPRAMLRRRRLLLHRLTTPARS